MSPNYGPYQATVVAIHDGDTVDVDVVLTAAGKLARSSKSADIDLGFGLWRTKRGVELKRQSIRLYGCNAAELATPAGKAALAFIETLLHIGDTVTLLSHGWDKYGDRVDGSITLADGRDLAQTMIAANQAAPWDGQGAKPVPAAA